MSARKRHKVIPRVLCLVFYQDEILLIKPHYAKELAAFYNAVGGHMEKGESVIDAANREIFEESSLRPEDTKLRGIVHVANFFGKDVMMFVTKSTVNSKKVITSPEGELAWVKISELSKLTMFEDMKPILKHVLEMNEGEVFVGTSEYDGKDKLLSLDFKVN